MDNSRYPKACYEMLRKLDEAGKTNWVTKIKQLLMRYGFANVWFEQQVGNCSVFLTFFAKGYKTVTDKNGMLQSMTHPD